MVGQRHNWVADILAIATVLIVGAVEGRIFFHGMPPGLDGVVVGRILGTMDSALMLVLAFYFGSNVGAARDRELLAQSSPGPTVSVSGNDTKVTAQAAVQPQTTAPPS